GAGHGHAGDPLALEHAAVALRRRLEEVVPDDVAGDESRGRRLQELERVRRDVLRGAGRLREAVGEAAQAADAKLERLQRRLVLDAERAGRMDRAEGGDVLLPALGEAVDLGLELAELDPLGGERGVELATDLRRVVGDDADLLVVVPVRALLAGTLAAGDPEDEQDDDQDGEGDQPGQAEERRHADGRTARRRPTRAAAFG